jgi:hypothetical protein
MPRGRAANQFNENRHAAAANASEVEAAIDKAQLQEISEQ